MDLAEKRCKPCEGGVQPLTREQSLELMAALNPGWSLSIDGISISRSFDFPTYDRALWFTNAVAWIAMVEDQHPVLTIEYGRCHVSYTTHAINGLSDNDFICAAKIDRIVNSATS
jgi:4a-hydroxytetrahydrobiopterin dehydratase